ncbi:MAG: formate dehydrogenase accessory protein FdhE [Syntrophaceae bacterium]|nr:formate dehydrogenase accessory protein FdhE [Syntrophaceae bacterium]
METLKKRVQQIKKKRPGYGEILNFYLKVKKEQDKVKGSLTIDPLKIKKEWKELLAKEGFSLIQKEDFPVDAEISLKLFKSLCQIGKDANPHMAEQVKKIEETIESKKIDLGKLFKEELKEQRIEQVAEENGLDKKVFSFLIQSSAKPSIEAGMDQLRSEVDPETWLKGYCPLCGSSPSLSLLKEEVGKRYLLCSYCGFQWRMNRLFCPFCNNKDQESLQYFYGEGEQTHRIDICEKCHQYIKTIDQRILGELDPVLEDLATFHLDLLASQKGYKRHAPNPWAT